MTANSQVVTVQSHTNEALPRVKQLRLDNTSLEVCGQMVDPGGYADIPKEEWEAAKANYAHLIKAGALTIEE